MSGTTDDRDDPRLTHGADSEPSAQAEVYLVLSDADRAKGFVRPLRYSYRHVVNCGAVTRINSDAIAETYARQPHFYGSTYCVACCMHLPVEEFVWDNDGQVVGS